MAFHLFRSAESESDVLEKKQQELASRLPQTLVLFSETDSEENEWQNS